MPAGAVLPVLTAEEIGGVTVFADLAPADRERLCRARRPTSARPGEYAMHEGDERALFCVLEGRIDVVKIVDGVERVIGDGVPGDVFGEVSIMLGMPQPAGLRAAEASRVVRIEPHDYYALAAAAPEIAKHVGRLAGERISGARGLQAHRVRAGPVPGDRPRPPVGCLLRRAAAIPRPQPGQVQMAAARRARRRGAVGRGRLPADGDYPAIRVVNGKTVVRPQLRRVAELLGHRDGGRGSGVRHRDRRRRARPGWRPPSTAPRRGCGRS